MGDTSDDDVALSEHSEAGGADAAASDALAMHVADGHEQTSMGRQPCRSGASQSEAGTGVAQVLGVKVRGKHDSFYDDYLHRDCLVFGHCRRHLLRHRRHRWSWK